VPQNKSGETNYQCPGFPFFVKHEKHLLHKVLEKPCCRICKLM